MNPTIRHLLVPVDFSSVSGRVADFARTLAANVHAEVHLLHVLEQPFTTAAPYELHLPDTPARRERLYTQSRARLSGIADEVRVADVESTIEVRTGTAADEIVKAAIDYGADMIAMGTQGRRALRTERQRLRGGGSPGVLSGALGPRARRGQRGERRLSQAMPPVSWLCTADASR